MNRAGLAAIIVLALLSAGLPEPGIAVPASVDLGASSPSYTFPGVPANFQIAYATNSSVKLTWQSPPSNGGSPITNYTVYRGTSLGAESPLRVLGPSSSYMDTSLRFGTPYFYEVSASNAAGEGRRTYEVAARVGPAFALTLGSTYLDIGPFLTSASALSPRSTASSVYVGVWTGYVNASTTLSMSGLPSGIQLSPSLPYAARGSFFFNLALSGSPQPSSNSVPIVLNARGPRGDNESLTLTLNVRSLGISAATSSLYLGQNETMAASVCPNPTPDVWANATLNLVYQRPDASQVTRRSVLSVAGANLCSGSVLDRVTPDATGTWYARAALTLVAWDGSTEYVTTQPASQPNYPPSFSISFTVSTPPPKSLAVSLTASSSSVQSGGTSIITAFVTASDGSKPSVAYAWSTSGGTLNSTSTNPVSWAAPVVQSSTSFVVSVVATAAGYAQASTSISLPVLPYQPLGARAGVNSSGGFAPLAVQFSGGAVGGYPPYAFSWIFGDGSTGSLQSPSHVYLSPGNYTATLTVTDSRSATSSASVIVKVLQRPALALSVSVTPMNGTSPLAVAFNSVVTGGTPPYGYAWSFGDGGASASASPYHTFETPGAYTATLVVTDAAGGTARSSVRIVVSAPSYTVAVSEVGLPSGTPWSVAFGGRTYSPNGTSVAVSGLAAGTYQWEAMEVVTCQGCRYVPLPTNGTIAVPATTTLRIQFQAEYLVTLLTTPAGGGTLSPAGTAWYLAGTSLSLSAHPDGTFILADWVSNQTIPLIGLAVAGGAATVTATINGPGTVLAQFADTWRGSYLRSYLGSQSWHPKIVEIHLASADIGGGWQSSAVTFFGLLQQGSTQVLGSVGPAGAVFSFITPSGSTLGTPNPDGSYDFTLIQVAGNAAYLYAGLYSVDKMGWEPVHGAPVWAGLVLSLGLGSDKLVFGDFILPYVTPTDLAASGDGGAQTILSLSCPKRGASLTAQDGQGRATGLDARSNSTVASIPGTYFAQVGSAMAVVLPANLTSFTYVMDVTAAAQPPGNCTLSVSALGATGFAAQKTFTTGIEKGSTATFGATISPGGIANSRLFAVSLGTSDPLGLPSLGATAVLTSTTGTNATISQGKTTLLPEGTYLLVMGSGAQGIRQTVNISHDGVVPVRVPITAYSVALIGGVVVVLGGALFLMRKRLPVPRRRKPKVSEWLK
jgi:PKD repeat protein